MVSGEILPFIPSYLTEHITLRNTRELHLRTLYRLRDVNLAYSSFSNELFTRILEKKSDMSLGYHKKASEMKLRLLRIKQLNKNSL